jgi:hypothetical protein
MISIRKVANAPAAVRQVALNILTVFEAQSVTTNTFEAYARK